MKALKKENRKLQDNIQGFMQQNNALRAQTDNKDADFGVIESEVHEHQDMITTLREQLEEAKGVIAEKEEQIDDLQQKLQIAMPQYADTADIIAAQKGGIAGMADQRTIKMVANQSSLRSATTSTPSTVKSSMLFLDSTTSESHFQSDMVANLE